MNEIEIWQGIIIGGVGGAIAGLFIWLLDLAKKCLEDNRDTKKIEYWLSENTFPNSGTEEKWRTSRAIASHNDLTEDRVAYICSKSEKIVLSTAQSHRTEEMWGVKARVRP